MLKFEARLCCSGSSHVERGGEGEAGQRDDPFDQWKLWQSCVVEAVLKRGGVERGRREGRVITDSM